MGGCQLGETSVCGCAPAPKRKELCLLISNSKPQILDAPRLRIGVLGIRGVPSTYSGYETFLTAMLPELAARGHDITTYVRGEDDGVAEWKGIKRRHLPSVESKAFETISHTAVGSVAARLSGEHDVLLCCNVACALFTWLPAHTGLPVVLNVDGIEWIRGKWGTFARRTFKVAARMAKFSATTLIADCEEMRSIYLREFGADSEVIPYCWPGLNDDKDPSEIVRLVNDLDLKERGYNLIGGRLNPENNIARIARSYIETDNPLPLVVLGAANYDSPERRAIERLMRQDDRIRFLGHIGDRSTYGALVGCSSIYFHGHSVGGMNPGLVEALGCGARIAAFETPFNRETVGDAAYLFPNPDTAARDAMQAFDLIDEEELRISAAKRAREDFSVERVANEYERVLVEAAATRR